MAGAAAARVASIAPCLRISPVADPLALLAQPMNDGLRRDHAEAPAESPALGRPLPGPRVSIHIGGDERSSILWQARTLRQAWGAPIHVADGRHHSDAIDALAGPGSLLVDDLSA